MNIKKILLKIFDKKKYSKLKDEENIIKNKNLYDKKIKIKLNEINLSLQKKDEINFLHSGHLGDVINALPLIKEISKTKKCNYYIEANKRLPDHVVDRSHPFGEFYLNDKAINMMLPLLKEQKFINIAEKYSNQNIDVNLNIFRELPLNFNLDSVRWYFHLTGIHANLNESYVQVSPHNHIQNKIIITRSSRRKNYLINYKFLNKYKNILFLGLENEYLDLKKEIINLEFHNCKNFLEMAQIIKSCRLLIGNLSLGFALAEAIKVPRLLESGPNFPLVYPNGGDGYDFYFQEHFEKLFDRIYSKER
tara:strand:- start:862 stop:1779 length:918 start_codon:yes stop_codon:yes gene_type:complete